MKEKMRRRWTLYFLCGIISVLLSANNVTFSHYTSAVTGNDAATVAFVDMSITTVDFSIDGLQPGGTKAITFNVVNFTDDKTSQVSQDYSITVSSTGNLPLTFALAYAGEDDNGAITADATGTTWTGGVLPHTVQTTHSYTLTVSWAADENSALLADEIDCITVTVDSQQKD